MNKYKCIKDIRIFMYDKNNNPTNEYRMIHKGDIFEYATGYIGNSDIRLYSENGDDDDGYIDITYDILSKHFKQIV
jgi:hypothetical protein